MRDLVPSGPLASLIRVGMLVTAGEHFTNAGDLSGLRVLDLGGGDARLPALAKVRGWQNLNTSTTCASLFESLQPR